MKTSPQVLISLCFIFFSIHTNNSLLHAPVQKPSPLRDIAVKELQPGVEYYMVSAIDGAGGGGVTVVTTGNETCPVTIIQEPFDVLYGLPLTFHPMNSHDTVLRLSTDLNIRFEAPISCIESTMWRVDNYNKSTGKCFLQIGGELGKPGCDTVRNWFRIEKYGIFYKLVYCPSVCDSTPVMCKDVGILVKDGFRRLALIDEGPFTFVLVKRSSLYLSSPC